MGKQGKPDKRSRAGNPTGRYFTWGKTDHRILSAEIRKKALLSDREIIPYLEEMQKDVEVSEIVTGQKVVVLFSGDSGFYSGAASMYRALQEEISAGRLQASVRILSGISSVAYLAAASAKVIRTRLFTVCMEKSC